MSEVDDLKIRVTELAKEKSRLQMATNILTELAEARGLSGVINHAISTIMNAWGGSNVILYYIFDNQWYQSDVYEDSLKIELIDDLQVEQVLTTGDFLEYVQESETARISEQIRFFGEQQIWIYPLKSGDEIFGAIKMEGVF